MNFVRDASLVNTRSELDFLSLGSPWLGSTRFLQPLSFPSTITTFLPFHTDVPSQPSATRPPNITLCTFLLRHRPIFRTDATAPSPISSIPRLHISAYRRRERVRLVLVRRLAIRGIDIYVLSLVSHVLVLWQVDVTKGLIQIGARGGFRGWLHEAPL